MRRARRVGELVAPRGAETLWGARWRKQAAVRGAARGPRGARARARRSLLTALSEVGHGPTSSSQRSFRKHLQRPGPRRRVRSLPRGAEAAEGGRAFSPPRPALGSPGL